MTVARDTSLVRRRRETQGLLLIELASLVEISNGLLSSIEGGFVPKPSTQQKIARALGCSPIDLWPDEWERAE